MQNVDINRLHNIIYRDDVSIHPIVCLSVTWYLRLSARKQLWIVNSTSHSTSWRNSTVAIFSICTTSFVVAFLYFVKIRHFESSIIAAGRHHFCTCRCVFEWTRKLSNRPCTIAYKTLIHSPQDLGINLGHKFVNSDIEFRFGMRHQPSSLGNN